MRRAAVLLFLAGMPLAALAATYEVESAPARKDEARARLEEVGEQEAGAPRLVRRFEPGAGWGWVVRVEDLDDVQAARRWALLLGAEGAPARIYRVDGGERVLVDVPAGSSPAAAPAAGAPHEDAGEAPEPAAVLRAAVRAHGGRKAGLPVLREASAVEVTFDRTIRDAGGELVARHRFARRGDALRLDVQVREGAGVDSVTVVRGDAAWIATGGEVTEREAARAREILGRFAPERLLAVPLSFPGDARGSPDWQALDRVVEERDGRVVLARSEPARAGLVRAVFEADSGRLVAITWRAEQGETTWRFSDYREVRRDLVVPFDVRVERDGREVEVLRILEFRLDPELPDDLFERPAPAAGGG